MKTSREGLDFIIAREALKTKAYRDGGNVLTIGIGHTSMAGPPEVKAGMVITEQEAKDIFARDIVKYEAAVSKALNRAPNQNQYDAMVSLCYNIGPGAFAVSSVVRNFNAGNLTAAANAFLMWVKDNGRTIPGLVKRRELEKALFLKSTIIGVDNPDESPETRGKPVQPIDYSKAIPVPKDLKSPLPITPVAAKPSFWAWLLKWVS